jgi:hypothetical protein
MNEINVSYELSQKIDATIDAEVYEAILAEEVFTVIYY